MSNHAVKLKFSLLDMWSDLQWQRDKKLMDLPLLLRDDDHHDEYEDPHNPKSKN